MSNKTIFVQKCDRCGHEQQGGNFDAWAQITVRQSNGPNHIGDYGDGKKDLCPKCHKEIMNWWQLK